jgi:cobalamin biosynthesis Co2+ chelatase CbiK
MHYSFPQDVVHTLQALPEYKKLLETLREMGVDVVHLIKYIRVIIGVPHF